MRYGERGARLEAATVDESLIHSPLHGGGKVITRLKAGYLDSPLGLGTSHNTPQKGDCLGMGAYACRRELPIPGAAGNPDPVGPVEQRGIQRHILKGVGRERIICYCAGWEKAEKLFQRTQRLKRPVLKA